MLKNIPAILSPELLKVLCEMGHGDTIVLADANFPSESVGKGRPVLRCDGYGIPALLDAVLTLFPLDSYTQTPVTMMRSEETKSPDEARLLSDYIEIMQAREEAGKAAIRYLERFAFYAEAGKAYAVVATGEMTPYANVILQKGVIRRG